MHMRPRPPPALIVVISALCFISSQTSMGEIAPAQGVASASYQLPPQLHFRAPQYVAGSEAGLVGDGHTDNTQTFRRLLGTGGRTIHISPGDYVTGTLVIPKNTVLLLDPGVIIRDSGKLGRNDRLINIFAGNVYIRARGATLEASRNSYHGGEQRHGVFIYGASNVVIDGLESDNNSGDGFYIGGPAGRPAENITLENCVASGNRRQGLSIVSARNVQIVDCTFENTFGTPPAYGIDLEPNSPNDWLDNIRMIRVRTKNNQGGGILVQAGELAGSPSRVSIDIVDHTSSREARSYQTLHTEGLTRQLRYTGSRCRGC
jgi:parallel beta-helix repeat protein